MPKTLQTAHSKIPTLGDHPALDFLNTVSQVNGESVDSLQNNEDVLQWLARAGWPVKDVAKNRVPSSLLETARALRHAIHTAVERAKTGQRNVAVMNMFLAAAESHMKLVSDKSGGLRLERQWTQHTVEQMLSPVAEAAAELLATGDLSQVKQCEDTECVLWFYDRTKSHHRRWCSMTTCGNRHKVAAFRKRRNGDS